MNVIRFKSLIFLVISLLSISSAFAAIPSGYYYYAKNKKQAALKTALHTYAAPMKEFEYGGGPGFTWEGFFYTDQKSDSSVVDMYSNTVRKFKGFSAVNGMHIEHSLPKSWWGGLNNNAYKDLFHLYPADAITNITKSNLPLGEVTGTPTLDNGVTKIGANGFETAYTENCFEPANEFKGDFARSYFYISTIYEDFAPLWQSPMMNNNTYPVWKPWALDLLLKWHHQDPVSPKELARIEAIYNLQGNRNPFIDYPDLADYIWGKDTANIFPFPNETEPFLLTPRRGYSINFRVILVNDVRTQKLHIQGANISSDISLKVNSSSTALSLSTSIITAANALDGIDVSISFSPVVAGAILDTLTIQGGGLAESLRIPLKALAAADFITLEPTEISPVGGTLNWISDPKATDYKLNVFQGDQQAGDLIIATYIEGSGWNKAIEIFNGTGQTVDLSSYSLLKQTDGTGDFGAKIQLSGALANNKSYVIANNNYAVNAGIVAKAQLLDSLISFNGNDAVALVRNGVTIDMVGPANAGVGSIWGMDVTLQRKSSVTHPVSTFNTAEWTTFPTDTYSMLGSHPMTLTTSSNYILQNALTGKTTSYPIQNLLPQNTYTYTVEAIRNDGNVAALNSLQLHTAALDIPILMQPTAIEPNSFTANWEETLFASGYLLNVFEVSGQPQATETEGFANVGTSGTPLPSGWTGNASAIYTSATSSGIAIPSINLKLNEWLQTKTYSAPVSNFTYMYKFASTSTGSSYVLDGLSNGSWLRIDSIPYKNTTKAYPVYTFNKSQAINTFRFKFNKVGSGNLAIDDVKATYGNQDTLYFSKDVPVTSNSSVVSNLKENNPYFYQVRATLGTAASLTSESVGVLTLLKNGILENNTSAIKIHARNGQITVLGLSGDELIQIYSLTGICISQSKANATEMNISLKQKGIYIIQIKNKKAATVFKFLNL